ncbi:phytanoyl-CoA dioxygenase family protein [Kribbella sp. NPDC051718]|uniref:phytanoyl-CoA dioxygenase family protein n=1 Tax=Kribbella sp. NPDC051718 TaxID=3155168 RepID=UPI0034129B5F
MDASEQYFFDVNGYLVAENILSPRLLDALNTAIDSCPDRVTVQHRNLADGAAAFAGDLPRSDFLDALSWPKPFCEPFRELITLPAALRRILPVVGDGLRLDSLRGTVMPPGAEGLTLHGGAGNPDSPIRYEVVDGRIRTNLVNVAYALTDVRADEGGFVCIPGSHKASFPCPPSIERLETPGDYARPIAVTAGSAVIFSEALIHGTLPWTGKEPRRTLFVRYSPGAICLRPDPQPPNYARFQDELTPLQRAVLEPPYHGNRPSIAELLPPVEQDHDDDAVPLRSGQH